VIALSAEDVRAVLDPASAVAEIDAAWVQEAAGRTRAPGRVTFDVEHGWFRVMPGALLDDADRAVMGVKVMALARGTGLSYLLLLYDERGGGLLAMLDASVLTQMRTGAVSAAFARRACPDGVSVVGVVGSGFEARGQLEMIAACIRVGGARVYSPTPERRAAFAEEMSARLGLPVEAVADPRRAVEAPLVVLATRATRPVVDGEWFPSGAVVISIGSTRPELREVDEATLARAGAVIVDHPAQTLAESGDVHAGLAAGAVGEHDLVALADALGGRVPLRRSADALVLFKPSGTAVQDLAIARLAYIRCVAAGRGRALENFLTVKPR
jgi:ornithine cyclodeaminase/alanine dehydrogenase